MKNQLRLALTLGLICLSLSVVASAQASVAALHDVQGEVSIRKSQDGPDAWTTVSTDMALESGDNVRTGNGTCVVSYSDQATFTVDPNTTFAVIEKPETQDISLTMGRLKAIVNKEKVIKPFQVVTPTAVGAVRGTDVNFQVSPGAGNQFSVDLLNGGPVQVYNNEVSLDLILGGKKKVDLKYGDGTLTITCDCGSDGPIQFDVQGSSYSANPCQTITIKVGQKTESPQLDPPDDTPGGNRGDETTPNENGGQGDDDVPPPSSPDGGND